jgi:predicted transposase/invertase (TIGR01784 family)
MTHSTRKYAMPMVDVIFKRVFAKEQNKDCLISLLSAVLRLKITGLKIKNSELPASLSKDKNVRLDVLAELDSGTWVNIEVQLSNQANADKRSLYYWSRVFGGQDLRGKAYSTLQPVYSIFITDFVWFTNTTEVASCFILKNRKTNLPLFENKAEMMELHFLEIPKYKETQSIPKSMLDKWMLYFKSQNDDVLKELKMSSPAMDKAISEIEVAKMSPKERRYYEARMAFLSDQASNQEHAEEQIRLSAEKGLQQGLQLGIKKGEQLGIKKGEQLGIKKGEQLGIKKGEQLGFKRGNHIGQVNVLRLQATTRFKDLSEETLQIMLLLKEKQLKIALELILFCKSKREFESGIKKLNVK